MPVLQLGRAFTIVPAWHGSIIVSLWSGGPPPPPSVPNRRTGFFSSFQSGARGEGWRHASDDSCWHARVIKPNETAHCSQRMDTGRGSNPPPSTRHRISPSFLSPPRPSPSLSPSLGAGCLCGTALARGINVESGLVGGGLLEGRAGAVEPAAVASVC